MDHDTTALRVRLAEVIVSDQVNRSSRPGTGHSHSHSHSHGLVTHAARPETDGPQVVEVAPAVMPTNHRRR
jgi:hypothetical protein